MAALAGDWAAAEAAYERCAVLAAAAPPDSEWRRFLGQARFCVGAARAARGAHEAALRAYEGAAAAGFAQAHALAQARGAALLALGRPREAAAEARAALEDGGGGGRSREEGFVDMAPVLRDLLARAEAAAEAAEAAGAHRSGGSGGGSGEAAGKP